ncbi:hypothetical protein HZ326_21422 [Fusarium oxysporum f. sp. albedinis]|nr:hypothetical protein HZ326_21422 [Fusarium oxysporum f. sp. albedinis]
MTQIGIYGPQVSTPWLAEHCSSMVFQLPEPDELTATSETLHDNWKTPPRKRERAPDRRREPHRPKNRSIDRPKSETMAAVVRAREQLEAIATNATDGPQRSYADITRLIPSTPQTHSRPRPRPPPTEAHRHALLYDRRFENKR